MISCRSSYAEARAAAARGALDHLHASGRVSRRASILSLPALLIAAPLFWPRAQNGRAERADAFDRRIVTLVGVRADGHFVRGRLTQRPRHPVDLWGYPLWLFLGLWLVMFAPAALERTRLARLGALWAAVFAVFVAAFAADYLVLPNFDHRYRAAFFPGDLLSAAITQRFEQATGQKPAYIIGSMWDGGNVAHYSNQHPQPRVLIDGLPRRAPWIDHGRSARPRRRVGVDRKRSARAAGKLLPRSRPAPNRRAVRSAVPPRRRRGPCRLGDPAPARR
jgi:hypothetical protein